MNNSRQKGIVILFAVLTIGLLIGIGVAMSGLTQKQLVLSNIGKQSQVAFYAADTGAECARYWDSVHNSFAATSTDAGGNEIFVAPKGSNAISCNGEEPDAINFESEVEGQENTKTTFQIDISSPVGFVAQYNYCAKVEVVKMIQQGLVIGTTIESRGYNLPCVAPNSSRKVERAVRLTY
ncbi:MAG: hypothetical protein M3Q63_02750 [bacterium]|nr:hypothetical protein [bacterium]